MRIYEVVVTDQNESSRKIFVEIDNEVFSYIKYDFLNNVWSKSGYSFEINEENTIEDELDALLYKDSKEIIGEEKEQLKEDILWDRIK